MRKKKYVLVFIIILLSVLMCFILVMGLRGQKVSTTNVKVGDIDDFYTEDGTLSFGDEYDIITKVSGTVKDVYVEENAHVKKGDILFAVDDTDYQYEKKINESNISKLQAQLEQSKINQLQAISPQEYLNTVKNELDIKAADYQSVKTVYEGSESLYKIGSISKVEYEQNKSAYETASEAWDESKKRYQQTQEVLAELKKSGINEGELNKKFYDSSIEILNEEIRSQETAIAQINEKLEECTVAADRDGIVVSIPVKKMSVIQAGTVAIHVKNYNRIQAQVEVLTSVAAYLKEGDPVVIIIKTAGKKDSEYTGQISNVYDFASKGTSALGLDEYRVQVKIDIDKQPDLIKKDGYDITARFCLYHGNDKLWVPTNAVFTSDKQDYIFQIKRGKVVKVPIDIEYQSATQAIIEEGIKPGTKIITNVDKEGIYEGARVYD